MVAQNGDIAIQYGNGYGVTIIDKTGELISTGSRGTAMGENKGVALDSGFLFTGIGCLQRFVEGVWTKLSDADCSGVGRIAKHYSGRAFAIGNCFSSSVINIFENENTFDTGYVNGILYADYSLVSKEGIFFLQQQLLIIMAK